MIQSRGYVDETYLRTVGALFHQDKQRTFRAMKIQDGYAVLDVGCGPGTDTRALALLVGPAGTVIGIDHDAAMIAEADRQAVRAGLAERVRHYRAEASALPLESNSINSSRSEQLFQHLPDPEAALSEMVRVTKPKGRVVVLDTDWGTASLDTPEVELEGRWARYCAERFVHNGFSGRMLHRQFRKQGLEDIMIEMRPVAFTSWPAARVASDWDARRHAVVADRIMAEEEVERLERSFAQAEASSMFFASISMMLVSGQKP